MEPISSDQLLSQIRTMGRELQVPPSLGEPEKASHSQFGSLLKSSLESVNQAQKASSAMKLDFDLGRSNKSLAEVMIASQKADLSFRAVTEVRNKLISAYQDVMNMPV